MMTWAYLAGFTDGDGCITVEYGRDGRYRYSRLRWAQKQVDSHVLYEIADFLRQHGLKVTARNFSVAYQGHSYPQAELGITNAEDTRKALMEMREYLIVKRDRAEQALTVLNRIHELKAMYGNKYRVRLAALKRADG